MSAFAVTSFDYLRLAEQAHNREILGNGWLKACGHFYDFFGYGYTTTRQFVLQLCLMAAICADEECEEEGQL
jgi:hypothetical protein